MRYTLIPIALVALAGCGRPLPKDAHKVVKADGTAPKTPREWADAYEAAKRARLDAERRENAAAEGLKLARQTQRQARLYWASGIAFFCALVCAVVAFLVSAVRKYAIYGAIAFVAVAALSIFFAWLVPYLLWVGVGLGVLGVAAGVVYWQRDRKGFSQVVAGFETLKPKLGDRLEAARDHMRQWVDHDVDAWIDAERKRRGLD